MNITITDNAKSKIMDATRGAEFQQPALRLVLSGIG
jgi:hypothetical protein